MSNFYVSPSAFSCPFFLSFLFVALRALGEPHCFGISAMFFEAKAIPNCVVDDITLLGTAVVKKKKGVVLRLTG